MTRRRTLLAKYGPVFGLADAFGAIIADHDATSLRAAATKAGLIPHVLDRLAESDAACWSLELHVASAILAAFDTTVLRWLADAGFQCHPTN